MDVWKSDETELKNTSIEKQKEQTKSLNIDQYDMNTGSKRQEQTKEPSSATSNSSGAVEVKTSASTNDMLSIINLIMQEQRLRDERRSDEEKHEQQR